MHPRNPFRWPYDIRAMAEMYPVMSQHIYFTGANNNTKYKFFEEGALIDLTASYLNYIYDIHWRIPPGNLCPTVSSRANYVHLISDIIFSQFDFIYFSPKIRILDIGTGANVIYPLIGASSYCFSYTGVDINADSIYTASCIVFKNGLSNTIKLQLQSNTNPILNELHSVGENDLPYVATMCNPPFYATREEAINSIRFNQEDEIKLGSVQETICDGGEAQFIRQMITESKDVPKAAIFFSSLIAKKLHVNELRLFAWAQGCKVVTVFQLNQGERPRWVLVWSFYTMEESKEKIKEIIATMDEESDCALLSDYQKRIYRESKSKIRPMNIYLSCGNLSKQAEQKWNEHYQSYDEEFLKLRTDAMIRASGVKLVLNTDKLKSKKKRPVTIATEDIIDDSEPESDPKKKKKKL